MCLDFVPAFGFGAQHTCVSECFEFRWAVVPDDVDDASSTPRWDRFRRTRIAAATAGERRCCHHPSG